MKSTTQSSFPHRRTASLAAAVAILVSAGLATAQTSGSSGSSSYGSGQKTQTRDTGSSGSGYSSGSTSSSSRDTSTSASSSASSTDPTTTTSASSTEAGAPTGRTATTSSDKLSWGDRRFVSKAADAGMAEVSLAQLAAEKATNTEVRNFAQKLVDDHSKVNSELTSLAGQKNVKIDEDAGKDRAYKRLSKKTGSEFDQEFVEHMIDEHEKDVKMFEKAASDAKDPEVRAFASKHVDHLRQHLQTAQSLRQTIMPTGRTDDTSSATGTTGSTSSSSDTSTSTGTTGTSSTSSPSSSPDTSSSTTTGSSRDSSATTPKRDGSP